MPGINQDGDVRAIIETRFIEQVEGIILVTPAARAQMVAQGAEVFEFDGPLLLVGFLHGELDGRMIQMKQNSASVQSLQLRIES